MLKLRDVVCESHPAYGVLDAFQPPTASEPALGIERASDAAETMKVVYAGISGAIRAVRDDRCNRHL